MRVRLAVALLIVGIAGITAARAADIPGEYARSAYNDFPVVGLRAGALYIYDYEPGVVVRAYWLPPWRNRHYFPASGRRPRVGRLEHISARGVPIRAESYYRSWSTAPAFYPGLPQDIIRDDVSPPHPKAPIK